MSFFFNFLLLHVILHDIIYGISFYLESEETKCLSDFLNENELLIGEFKIKPIKTEQDGGVLTTVSDPTETTVYEKNVDNGKFAFNSPTNGEYVFCFNNYDKTVKTVSFDTHSGVKAKDYSNVVKRENLKPMETQMKRLEDLSRDTLKKYNDVRIIEENIYSDNVGSTSKGFWFGIIITIILIGMSIFQIQHLKSFFKKKKMF
mmetsp:Transcript_87578/g.107342  ORF Transcript_87578/g.107342 Transcript_87578/m.107342 type:complete len:203 (-) Transcript_87578:35-643(-)